MSVSTSDCAGCTCPTCSRSYRGTPYHDNGFDPSGVLLVVEAVSPSSVTMDRVTKPAIYAEQGIPYFWRIDALDEGAVRLEAYALHPDVRDVRQGGRVRPR